MWNIWHLINININIRNTNIYKNDYVGRQKKILCVILLKYISSLSTSQEENNE